jgi:hypothetical protein
MSVDTNATNEFKPLEEALADATETIRDNAPESIILIRSLDAQWVGDHDSGSRFAKRQRAIKKAAVSAAGVLRTAATQTEVPHSAASRYKIDVENADFALPVPDRCPYIKSTHPTEPESELPRMLRISATITAKDPSHDRSQPEVSTQASGKHVDFKLEYENDVWKPVEDTVADGTLVLDASQSGA